MHQLVKRQRTTPLSAPNSGGIREAHSVNLLETSSFSLLVPPGFSYKGTGMMRRFGWWLVFSAEFFMSKMIMKLEKNPHYLDHASLSFPLFILCESPNVLLIKRAYFGWTSWTSLGGCWIYAVGTLRQGLASDIFVKHFGNFSELWICR